MGEIQIFSALIFYGFGYVVQRYAMVAGIGPLSFNAVRFVISTFLMYLSKDVMSRYIHNRVEDEDDLAHRLSQHESQEKDKQEQYELWLWGSIAGITAFGGSSFDALGLVTVSAGKTAFIDNMYVVFVPIIVYFIPGLSNGINVRTWIAAITSFIGLYFLSGCAEAEVCIGGAFATGEFYVLIAMVCWSLNIISIEYGAKAVNVIELTYVNYVVSSILSLAVAVVFEFDDLKSIWFDDFYLVIIMGFLDPIGFLLGSLGQMYVSPSRSALLYSFESIMSAILGFFILDETLTWLEILGCCIMSGAAVMSSSLVGGGERDGYQRIEESEEAGLGKGGAGGYVFVDTPDSPTFASSDRKKVNRAEL